MFWPKNRSETSAPSDEVDNPGSSLLAIRHRRAETAGELKAHVYRYAQRHFLVTSIMSIPGSVILETGEPSVLPFDVSDEDIGGVICEHLLRHDAREPPNLHDRKLTDWLVFQASGDTSVSGFQTKSSIVTVSTMNLILELEAKPVRSPHPDLCVKAVVQPRHQELGAAVRIALKAADILQRARII